MDISKIGRNRALEALYNAALTKIVPADAPKQPDQMTEEDAEGIFDARHGFYICTLVRHNFPVTNAGHTVWNHWSITIDVDFEPDDIDLASYDRMYGAGFGEETLATVEPLPEERQVLQLPVSPEEGD